MTLALHTLLVDSMPLTLMSLVLAKDIKVLVAFMDASQGTRVWGSQVHGQVVCEQRWNIWVGWATAM